jgi:hypothetical protein
MAADFGKRHWAMMIGMSLLALAVIFGAGLLLSWFADRVA